MAQQKTCSFCGTPFQCGVNDAAETCWCTHLPNVMPYPGSSDCLCPECLKIQVEKVIAYDAVSHIYAQKFGNEIVLKPGVQGFIQDFAKAVPADEIICDMGCGPGQVARYLHNNLHRNTSGIDLSPKMIEEAKNLNPKISFQCADAMNLEETGAFAGIIALYFIVNFPPTHLPLVFNKLHNLLQNKGQLLLSFHIGGDELLRVESLWDSGKPLSFYMFSPETVVSALIQSGFCIKEIRYRHPDKAIEYESERAYIFAERE